VHAGHLRRTGTDARLYMSSRGHSNRYMASLRVKTAREITVYNCSQRQCHAYFRRSGTSRWRPLSLESSSLKLTTGRKSLIKQQIRFKPS